MPRTVLYIAVILLAIYGLGCLIRAVVMRLFSYSDGKPQTLLVLLEGHSAEISLRCAVEKMRYYGSSAFSRIIAVDCGVSREIREVCNIIADECEGIEICDINDVSEKIKSLS